MTDVSVRLLLSPLVPMRSWTLFRYDGLAYSRLRMQDHTETLRIGSPAPDFTLTAANRERPISLSGLLASGSLIVEFLRGTW